MSGEKSLGSLGARGCAAAFCERYGLQAPILQAPMAGSSPVSLAATIANTDGMGGLGALLTSAEGIENWVAEFRAQSNASLQLNLWIEEHAPARDPTAERPVREFLSKWGLRFRMRQAT
jgi:nitronate monooxygenase